MGGYPCCCTPKDGTIRNCVDFCRDGLALGFQVTGSGWFTPSDKTCTCTNPISSFQGLLEPCTSSPIGAITRRVVAPITEFCSGQCSPEFITNNDCAWGASATVTCFGVGVTVAISQTLATETNTPGIYQGGSSIQWTSGSSAQIPLPLELGAQYPLRLVDEFFPGGFHRNPTTQGGLGCRPKDWEDIDGTGFVVFG